MSLEITTVQPSQNDKVTTINEALLRLEGAIAERLQHAMPDANDTLTEAEANENMVIEITGTLTASRVLNTRAQDKLYILKDSTTGGTITFQPTGGSGIVLPKGTWVLVHTTGGNSVEDLSQDFGTAPDSDQNILAVQVFS